MCALQIGHLAEIGTAQVRTIEIAGALQVRLLRSSAPRRSADLKLAPCICARPRSTPVSTAPASKIRRRCSSVSVPNASSTPVMLALVNLMPRNSKLRSAPWSCAPEKSTPSILAVENSAPCRCASTNFASSSWAPSKFAPRNFAPVKFAPCTVEPGGRTHRPDPRPQTGGCADPRCRTPPVSRRGPAWSHRGRRGAAPMPRRSWPPWRSIGNPSSDLYFVPE